MALEQFDFEKTEKILKKKLDTARYRHTLGVMYTAAALAMAHGADMKKAQIAGLLHDCAKCLSDEKRLHICHKNKIAVSTLEAENPFLLHAKVGAYLAKTRYEVKDPEILDAIVWHTTGTSAMSDLAKILYIADYIEPGRDKAPRLSEVRRLAYEDLDECMYQILKDSVAYLKNSPKTMDSSTEEAFLYYTNHHNGKKN